MTFLWPQMLLLLLLVPALVGAYLWLLRRKKKEALRYASVSLFKQAIGPGQTLRRHLPALLLLLSFIAAIVAIARPTAVVTLPSKQQTIILVMDVSLSMGARDVDPNRITAAQAAAKTFVEEHPPEVQIGIVSFGATPSLVRPGGGRTDRIRGRAGVLAPRKRTTEGDRQHRAGRVFLRGQGGSPREGVPGPQCTSRAGKKRSRDRGAVQCNRRSVCARRSGV